MIKCHKKLFLLGRWCPHTRVSGTGNGYQKIAWLLIKWSTSKHIVNFLHIPSSCVYSVNSPKWHIFSLLGITLSHPWNCDMTNSGYMCLMARYKKNFIKKHHFWCNFPQKSSLKPPDHGCFLIPGYPFKIPGYWVPSKYPGIGYPGMGSAVSTTEVVDGSNESFYHANEEIHPLVRNFSPFQTIFQNLDLV